MCSMFRHNGVFKTGKVCEGKNYGGQFSNESKKGGPDGFLSFFRYEYHGRGGENTNKTIERSCERDVIIRVIFFYGRCKDCSTGRIN